MKRVSICLSLAVAFVLSLVVAVPAEAQFVSGQQTIVNANAGKFKMKGGLIGNWAITSFKQLSVKPVFKIKGTEKFDGCMDVNRDRSCQGDPTGTLTFKFVFWGHFQGGDPSKAEQLGTCAHPVTGGTGGFATASGFLMMVDTPIGKPPFIKTHYEGVINLTPTARPRAATPC
jgi:hypothetical protein